MTTAPTIPVSPSAEFYDARERAAENPGLHDSPLRLQKAAALDQVRDGEAKAPGLLKRLHDALRGERKALDAVADAEAKRREAEGLQAVWENEFVEPYQRFTERIAIAAEEIAAAEKLADSERHNMRAALGKRGNITAASFARSAFLAAESVKLLRPALDGLRAELRAHVAKMKQFGQANGVPAEIIAALTD